MLIFRALPLLVLILAALCPAVVSIAQTAPAEITAQPAVKTEPTKSPTTPAKFSPRTFYITWGGTDKEPFTKYIQTVKPQVVQAGWFGGMFHSYVNNPDSRGYPMQLPKTGVREAVEHWKEMVKTVHDNGGKSIAHFTLNNVIQIPDKPGSFVDFYEHNWPVDLLGEKPTLDYKDLLAKNADGTLISSKHYHITYHGLCVVNPKTRQFIKQMLKLAISTNIDGVITLYNYRWNCACDHCQASFKTYLKTNYTPAELKAHFSIDDLAATRFETIPGRTPGYPPADATTPFALAAHQWSGIAFKEAWNDIFVNYGRSLKPDLILAQWNHLGNVGITEERAFLPGKMWGEHEDYFWYSGNHYDAKVEPGNDNDGWLNGLYIRALNGNKPHLIGRYDPVRTRAGLSEAMALGGPGTGLYNHVNVPETFAVMQQYQDFAKTAPIGAANTGEMIADTCLIIPRQSQWAGHRSSFDTFRTVGTELARRQQPMLMCADEAMSYPTGEDEVTPPHSLANFRVVILPETVALTDAQIKMLEEYVSAHSSQHLFIVGDAGTLDNKGRPWSIAAKADSEARLAGIMKHSENVTRITKEELANFDWSTMWPKKRLYGTVTTSPINFEIWTEQPDGKRVRLKEPNSLRVSLWRDSQGRQSIHLVNYARNVEEAAKSKASNPSIELPIPTTPIWVRIIPPLGLSAIKTEKNFKVYTPDTDAEGKPEKTDIQHIDNPHSPGENGDWVRVGPVTVYRILTID